MNRKLFLTIAVLFSSICVLNAQAPDGLSCENAIPVDKAVMADMENLALCSSIKQSFKRSSNWDFSSYSLNKSFTASNKIASETEHFALSRIEHFFNILN